MRIRALLVGLILGLVPALVAAHPAWAQEGESRVAGEAEEECIHLLEEGKKIDDCQEAPSPILPAANELIWGAISFTVLFVLLAKLAYPAMRSMMEARAERIRSSLEEAEHAKNEAERVLDEYRSQLAEAKGEAGRVIEEARQQADAMRRDLQARAEADIAELRQRAAADVEAAKAQAVADLRTDVAELAIGAAEVLVQRNLDRDTQLQLIENYINQVGASGGR